MNETPEQSPPAPVHGITTCFRLQPDVLAKLDGYARQMGMKRSSLLQYAVNRLLIHLASTRK